MTYIINPFWFYLVDLAGEINFVCCMVMICCAIAAFISIMNLSLANSYEDTSTSKKVLKMCIYTFIAAIVIGVLVPSKETMLTMMVAKFATYENAAWTLDTVKAAVDYIINAIDSL